MNLALRILGVAIFVSAVAGASFGALQAFDRNPSLATVEATAPGNTPVTLLSGGSTPTSIGLQNTGDTNLTVTAASGTDGFTFAPARDSLRLPAGATRQLRGTLSADGAPLGATKVTIEVLDATTDRRIAKTTFKVKVIEGGSAQLTMDPTLPAALPGQNLTLQAEATNPIPTQQTFNFTATGANATVEPASVDVQPNGTGSTTVTAQVPSTASGTISITLTATTASGDAADVTTRVPVLGSGEIAVGAVFEDLVVRPGNRYRVPLLVVSNLADPAPVSVEGENVVGSDIGTAQPADALGGFATLEVPSSASGTLTETLTLTVGDATRQIELSIDTQPTGETASQGMQASVDYVGQLSDGRVFDTSVPEVAHGPFPKSDTFRLRPGLAPIPVQVTPNPRRMIPGFVDAVRGMAVNETQTVVIPPSEAYGPVRTHENLSATTEIQRENSVTRLLEDIPRNRVPPSFDIKNASEGDILTYETTTGNVTITFQFELVEKGEQTVTLKRVAEVGDTTTFYAPWPNQTEVVKVNETTIVYRTTPPEDAGNFTWDAQQGTHEAAWENATTVKSVNETTIVLLHQPEEGITYEAQTGGRFGQTKTYRVEDVNQTTVHVSTPNDHPLAGKTLTFTITVQDVQEPPQRSRMPIGGGR